MDSFEKAFRFTIKHEGGYANDPSDYGGETIFGISRVHWPNWAGWKVVDTAKKKPGFPESLYGNRDLDQEVMKFYKKHFWDPNKCDVLAEGSLDVAAEVFDTSVNMGISRGAKFLQFALNVFNRDQKNYRDLKVDGKIGPATIGAFRQFLKHDNPSLLMKAQLLQRGSFYVNLALAKSSQERFIRGWLNRLVIDKGFNSES